VLLADAREAVRKLEGVARRTVRALGIARAKRQLARVAAVRAASASTDEVPLIAVEEGTAAREVLIGLRRRRLSAGARDHAAGLAGVRAVLRLRAMPFATARIRREVARAGLVAFPGGRRDRAPCLDELTGRRVLRIRTADLVVGGVTHAGVVGALSTEAEDALVRAELRSGGAVGAGVAAAGVVVVVVVGLVAAVLLRVPAGVGVALSGERRRPVIGAARREEPHGGEKGAAKEHGKTTGTLLHREFLQESAPSLRRLVTKRGLERPGARGGLL